MKLLLGKVLIETDHIEWIEKLSGHTLKCSFVSGNTLDVIYGVKTTSPVTWDMDAEALFKPSRTRTP